MTLDEFRATLHRSHPPDESAPTLVALWHDARGDWDAAHQAVQDIETSEGAWVHAYLHRKEGDAANAAYWYGRARQPVAHGSLDDEWKSIVSALLSRHDRIRTGDDLARAVERAQAKGLGLAQSKPR